MLPKTVISSASNTYAKKSKRLGIQRTAAWAAANGHLHILEYLVERKYDQYSVLACRFAAQRRPLRLFEVLTRNRQRPWDSQAVREAHENNHTDCVQYLLDNDCPLPDGWLYEGGTLHTADENSDEFDD